MENYTHSVFTKSYGFREKEDNCNAIKLQVKSTLKLILPRSSMEQIISIKYLTGFRNSTSNQFIREFQSKTDKKTISAIFLGDFEMIPNSHIKHFFSSYTLENFLKALQKYIYNHK